MDLWVSKSPKRLEFLRADIPGPFQHGYERGLLARWQQASVRMVGRDRPRMERGDGASRADVRGPFRLGYERGLLARRQQASVRIVRRDRLGMERGDGASRADARRPF